MKGSEFVFDYVHLLYNKCHKTNLNRGGLSIDSHDWIKNKKTTINHVTKKRSYTFSICCNSCFKSRRIGKCSERITKTKNFINKYNWEEINFSSEKHG